MATRPDIVINGKFLSVPMTGVHRVAHELANALAEISAERKLPEVEVWLPEDGTARAAQIRLPTRVKRPLHRIPWEQITLPLAAGDRLILNLCNIGPILSRNAITMIHDAQVHIARHSYSRGFRLWYKFVQPIIARRHRHILTVSEFSRRQLIAARLGTPDKVSVVHNGVDHVLAVQAEPEAIDRLGLAQRGFVVALASMQPHKNIPLLISAFEKPALAHLKLVLIGDSDAAAFAEMAPSLPRNVIVTGRISDGALRALYEAALCVAFPSTTEGFGLPPVEAMRVGCPAIVAPCGALPEVCGDAAIYADPASAQAWTDAILALSRDAERWQAASEAGRAQAARFTWRAAAEQLLAVLAAQPAMADIPPARMAHAPA